ncbi:Fe-S cluster assembly protein SufD [Acidisoma silvae]|uniref:Fe-S cluster assembly protein SufD n=1 Tax=Acidisoma silvae TaxID=2802396 RepID=A0A964DY81_9PROT|nr:Fe-S cluster assembly protein SufD [Acidisoma silvae]MCB8874996.1 Fe-S cluster assembly protein SufD [Acidisoma silvae]
MQAVKQQAPSEALKGFLARYDGLRVRLPGNAAPRDAAAALLRDKGLPTPKEEAWHYTNLRSVAALDFQEPIADTQAGVDLLALLPKVEGPRLIFVDGRYRPDLSTSPDGLEVKSFAGTGVFGDLTKPERDRVVALNTMLTEDGIIIDVPAGFDAGFLMLAQLTSGRHRRVASHPRHRISLGEGARLVLLEVSAGIGEYLNNPVIEIAVAEGAHLTHGRLQQDSEDAFHLGTIYADTAANGVYDCFSLALGAKLGRTEIHARLGGEQAAVHLNAAQIMGGNQVSDFTTAISHDAPNCPSRQTVKSVLTGKARAVFQGRIEVARIAQKTDGYQMNQALLLSPDAEINSKPELEIYADDVKCSHGATVGALDPEQLFYLRSRGVPADQARMILVRAFLTDAFEAVAHEGLRDVFEHAVEQWWATTGKDAEAPAA